MTATQQRAAADYLTEAYDVSQRRASRLLGRARSTLRYRPRDRSAEAANETMLGPKCLPLRGFMRSTQYHWPPIRVTERRTAVVLQVTKYSG